MCDLIVQYLPRAVLYLFPVIVSYNVLVHPSFPHPHPCRFPSSAFRCILSVSRPSSCENNPRSYERMSNVTAFVQVRHGPLPASPEPRVRTGPVDIGQRGVHLARPEPQPQLVRSDSSRGCRTALSGDREGTVSPTRRSNFCRSPRESFFFFRPGWTTWKSQNTCRTSCGSCAARSPC